MAIALSMKAEHASAKAVLFLEIRSGCSTVVLYVDRFGDGMYCTHCVG